MFYNELIISEQRERSVKCISYLSTRKSYTDGNVPSFKCYTREYLCRIMQNIYIHVL